VGDVGNIDLLGEASGGTAVVLLPHVLGESVTVRRGDSDAWGFLGVDVTITDTFFFGVRGGVPVVSSPWSLLGRAVVTFGRIRFGDIGVVVLADTLSAHVSVILSVVEAPIGGSLTSFRVCCLATELDSSISSSSL
jgi:hypothetical protein